MWLKWGRYCTDIIEGDLTNKCIKTTMGMLQYLISEKLRTKLVSSDLVELLRKGTLSGEECTHFV